MPSAKAKLKVALTGGGTGGHIYPCLSVAEILKQELNPGNLFYLGNHNKLEAKLLTEAELLDYEGVPYSKYIKLLPIEAWPLPKGKNPFSYLAWLLHFGKQVLLCVKYLKGKDINVVFGTGGYVSAPVFAACIILRIKYIIHNLDAHLGLANKVFVPNASILTLAFPEDTVVDLIRPRSNKVMVVGNPVSKRFSAEATKVYSSVNEDNERANNAGISQVCKPCLNILVTGGSQGAESINESIGRLLPRLVDLPSNCSFAKLNIVHVTGAKLFDEYVHKYLGGLGGQGVCEGANNAEISQVRKSCFYANYQVLAYTHEMPKLCQEADIAICRSGAMTVAEMAITGTVPIFVPLPWAANDHQNKNAKSLVSGHAAFSIDQSKLSESEFDERLFTIIMRLANDRELLEMMRANLKNFARTDSSEILTKMILTY
jgi:UDP-N-acetylglucosamine--N-acetylmuramyl-(pentapeptide) pyrophosphoryl-undecaprenol N-acetylglucosamine transferase